MKKNTSIINPAFKNYNVDFNSVVSEAPSTLKTSAKRIPLQGKFYDLNLENTYTSNIYQHISAALRSDWYQSLSGFSQISITATLKNFIPWLNVQVIDEKNKFTILKEFEIYRVKKVKPQSTGLSSIISLLNHGINEIVFESSSHTYIKNLLLRTNISLFEPPIPETLTSFFSSIQWLRSEIGDERFLKLESPKRLINSFSVTIATILVFILNNKKEARLALEKYHNVGIDNKLSNRSKRQLYCGNLFAKLSSFNENYQPTGRLTDLMIMDFVPKNNIKKIILLSEKGAFNPEFEYKINGKSRYVFTKPNIFSPDAWDYPSELEQVLFAWLCAWQTVQPYDVAKLKKNDFILSTNSEGRAVSVQCTYYKGRSGRYQEPPMLDSRQIEAKAIISYLDYFDNNNTNLIRSINIGIINLTFGMLSITERLVNLINYKYINDEIFSNLWKRKASPIFIESYLALNDKKEFSFSKWINKLKKIENRKSGFTVADYKQNTPYPLPSNLFGLNAIKNSAVHASSDRYREDDLVNMNSHTSETEKISYLTDANKEWINQNGRITRLVLHDIEKYVYKPNLDMARKDAHELKLRTKVIAVLSDGINDSHKVKINSIGQVNFNKDLFQSYGADADEILVLDTEETVVTMLHYVMEASSKHSLLIRDSLTFFERTVLPTVEWMEYLLSYKLSADIVRKGKSKYEKIKSILPNLFLNELNGTNGI